MMSKLTIDEILVTKPEARLRIYAYSIDDKAHKGLLKVGQTTRDAKLRIQAQTQTAGIAALIHLDEPAERVKVNKFASAVLKTFHCERRGNVGNIIDF